MDLYTIHARDGDLRVVGEAGALAAIPPLWALWQGLWLGCLAMILALLAVAALKPLAGGALWLGLIALVWTEGASLARLEWRLRGWREVGVALADSEEGAEELHLTGRAVAP